MSYTCGYSAGHVWNWEELTSYISEISSKKCVQNFFGRHNML